ncbi:hypothetical protein [Actinoplanes sp. NPDC051851]|uniref:hypothetical protein n=1 Tax=Actinoplanes sp. NPDC051851 TaxID=3154753 RepID=UPI00341DF8CC
MLTTVLVETLLDAPLHVHYGFFALETGDASTADPDRAFRGHLNGLCGSALPGLLQMRSGLHTGTIHVRAELHTDEPPLGDRWPDVVETLFAQPEGDTWLTAFDDSAGPVDLPIGIYRARFCGRDIQRGHDLGTEVSDEPVDHYLLQFWPATGLDRVVRQGSEVAAYRHRPTPPWTGDELAERVVAVRTERDDRDVIDPDDPNVVTWAWHGETRLEIDPMAVAALAEADDEDRRAVVAWAVERRLDRAGLLHHAWAPRAIEALRAGTEPPDRFEVTRHLPPMPVAPGVDDHIADQHLAVEAMFNAAVDPAALATACEVVWTAVTRDGDPAGALTRLRASFPNVFEP